MDPMSKGKKNDRGWFGVLRRRAATWVFAIAALAVATISFAGLPTWPVVGFAVLCVATAVNSIASRLQTDRLTCLGCGEDVTREPAGTYGVVCPTCTSTGHGCYGADSGDPILLEPDERQ